MGKPLTKTGNGQVIVPALILDADGTLRGSKSGQKYIAGPEDIELLPNVQKTVVEYYNQGYFIAILSNQGGVAFGHKTPATSRQEMIETSNLIGHRIIHAYHEAYGWEAGGITPYNKRSLLRKPEIGMVALVEQDAANFGYVIDWDNSIAVGDMASDQEMARRAGIRFEWAYEFFGWEKPLVAIDEPVAPVEQQPITKSDLQNKIELLCWDVLHNHKAPSFAAERIMLLVEEEMQNVVDWHNQHDDDGSTEGN